MKHNACKDCQFWLRWPDYVAHDSTAATPIKSTLGTCKRNAPTSKGFPETPENDWCGEFKRLPELELCFNCHKPVGEEPVYIGVHIVIHKDCEAEYYAKWPKYVGAANG